jgi:phosphate starvation-inducible protein PhoH and related proteins
MSRKKRNGNGNGNDNGNGNSNGNVIETAEKEVRTIKRITVTARGENQKALLKSIKENLITIAAGPPGSGKTMLSVVSGLKGFIAEKYDRMIFTRPCVEANGENLGFLPGDLNEKIHPYMYPIFDFLSDYLTIKQIETYVKNQCFLTLPLAFQRGMTFRDAFVLLDEAQNTTPEQVRMFLTRIGENCKVVITGDPLQTDIKSKNGLVDACERLRGIDSLGIIQLSHEDIVRNPIVRQIEERYSEEK